VTSDSDLLPRIIAATGLEVDSERMPVELVDELLRHEYDLAGTLVRIDTEKDDTFRLDADGLRYLVKISPAAEDAGVVNLQSAAMAHLEDHAPNLPVQRLFRGVRGQIETPVRDRAQRVRILRVLRYIDGTLLHDLGASLDEFSSVGIALARLDGALRDFRHPHESRLLLWDLANFTHTRALVDYVDDPSDRDLALRIYDQFDGQVQPVVDELETQTIHGDFSPFNMVVDPAAPEFVTGIIDFGDVVRSPILFELSVTAANLVGVDPRAPWAAAAALLGGYREVHPIADDVAELLAVTAPARLLLRALVYGWRCAVDPSARDYALSHSARDWQRLRTAVAVDRDAVRSILARSRSAVPPTP
jgi:hydroxylysine kinase